MRRERREQGCCRKHNAATRESRTKFFQSAPNAHLRACFSDTQDNTHFRERLLFEETKHNRVSVGFSQASQNIIEKRGDLVPYRVRSSGSIHLGIVLVMFLTALLCAKKLHRHKMGGAIKPPSKNRCAGEF